MAALTAPRVQTERLGEDVIPPLLKLPVAAATTIYAGAMVGINAGGFAVPMTAATGLRCAGRAEKTVDNPGSNGAKVVTVRRGVFKWDNSAAADAVAQALVGQVVYAVDDQTVAATDGTGARSPAGIVLQVEPDGVFVETGSNLALLDLI